MFSLSVLPPIQGPFASFQPQPQSDKPAYKSLPLPVDWTIVRQSGMKLYLHTPTGVLTDKDTRRPKVHKVIKGKITRLVDATRRGSAELLETISISSRVSRVGKPMKMRSKTKSYEHSVKRTPLSAPAASSRKSLKRARISLMVQRVQISRDTKKELRPGMVRRGRQPFYLKLKSEAVKRSARSSLETIVE